MRVLITGITGMVGSHLAEYCLERGDVEVFGTIRWRSPRDNIVAVADRVQLVETDLRDQAGVRRLLEQVQPEAIFHLAAQSFVPASWTGPADTMMTNVLGQVHLLEAMRDLGLTDVPMQIAGSSEEYGLVRPEETPITEENPLRPLSPYAVSKVTQDMLGWQYHQSFGLRTVRTRAFNHEGPRRGEVFVTSNFAKQIALIEAGKQPPVLEVGNLEARRDWHDVRDTVVAYWKAAFEGEPGDVYNIGRGEALSIQGMLDILLSMAKVDVEVRPVPERMRPSDVELLLCDPTKFRDRTGWTPTIPLDQTLRDTLEYWRESLLTENVLDVALDVTPLIGARSGVGHFVAEILDAMQEAPGMHLVPYSLSFRGRRPGGIPGLSRPAPGPSPLPAGTRQLPFPATAAIAAWGRMDQPSAERWLAPASVVHGTNFIVPPMRGAAAVVTVHDLTFDRFPEMVTAEVRRMVPALRRAVDRGAWVHTPSQFVATEAKEVLGTDRVVVVPHGVPRIALTPTPLGGLVGDSQFILAMGTLEPRKNISRLVAAFGAVAASHPGLQLLLAGADGPAKPAVLAAQTALPAGIQKRVHVAGYVDERLRATLLSRASVFAYPSLYEGFGFPVLEAMAAGTPVVAGNAGAIPEVAGDGALLVDPTDVDAIAEGLTRVLDDPALAESLVRAGRKEAAGYSWRRSAEGLTALYHRAADAR